MSTTEVVAGALGEYREMLRADQADLDLVGVDGGVVSLRLVLGPETCQECVLSKDMLEAVLLDGLRCQDPAVTAVVVDDPRLA
jgi:hypothetical protein